MKKVAHTIGHKLNLEDPPAKNVKDEQRRLHREDPKTYPFDPDAPVATPKPKPMSPHERADYLRKHPELIKATQYAPGTELQLPDGGWTRAE